MNDVRYVYAVISLPSNNYSSSCAHSGWEDLARLILRELMWLVLLTAGMARLQAGLESELVQRRRPPLRARRENLAARHRALQQVRTPLYSRYLSITAAELCQ